MSLKLAAFGYSCLNDKLEKIDDILPVMRHALKKSFAEATFFVTARNGKDGIAIHVFKFNPGNMGLNYQGQACQPMILRL